MRLMLQGGRLVAGALAATAAAAARAASVFQSIAFWDTEWFEATLGRMGSAPHFREESKCCAIALLPEGAGDKRLELTPAHKASPQTALPGPRLGSLGVAGRRK